MIYILSSNKGSWELNVVNLAPVRIVEKNYC